MDDTKRIAVSDLEAGQKIKSTFMVISRRLGNFRDRSGYFLSMVLGDKTGQVEAKLWDGGEEFYGRCREGDIVVVTGETAEYRGSLQLYLDTVEVCGDEGWDPVEFLPASSRDTGEMLDELHDIISTVKNPCLRRLLDSFFTDRAWVERFSTAPAAKRYHQAHIGGLLEHTLNVARAALKILEIYPHVDADLLLTGAIIHDFGKIEEFKYDRLIDYTDEGRMLGHIVLGIKMVGSRIDEIPDFPEKLRLKVLHMIASHHGEYEWQSPKRPKFLEAALVHQLDLMDAVVDVFTRAKAEKENDSGSDGNWTSWVRALGRYVYTG